MAESTAAHLQFYGHLHPLEVMWPPVLGSSLLLLTDLLTFLTESISLLLVLSHSFLAFFQSFLSPRTKGMRII